jgi:Bacterial Ig domain
MTHIDGSRGVVLFLSLAMLAACGGGGSSGPPPPPANRPPVLATSAFAVDEDASLALDLMATDPEGATVTFAKAVDPTSGVATLSSAGALTYSPNTNFNGSDLLSIRIADASGSTAIVTISITVRAVNDAPVAVDDELRIGTGTVSVPLLANDTDVDSDALSVTILAQPRGGVVSAANGVVTFQPENAFVGPTSFRYSITDAAGVSAEATTRLVVGEFPGVVFVSDETTLGTRELHLYDGFHTVRIGSPLSGGTAVEQFSIADDAQHVAYVVKATNDQVFLADLRQPGTARSIYRSPGPTAFESTRVQLNRDGSFAMIRDANVIALQTLLVKTSDGTATILGAANPELTARGLDAVFNPVTDEFYIQAQVGAPGFMTLYAGKTTAPTPLNQIGASYPVPGGNGSGFVPAVTRDGERVVHQSVVFGNPGPSTTANLLVNHRPTLTETHVPYAFAPYEFEFPLAFDLSKDSKRVCYILNALPSSNSRVWYSEFATPGHAVAVTPATASNYGCTWAADDRTLVYWSTVATGPQEIWSVDTLQPAAQRVREPMVAGETLYFMSVARKSQTVLLGISPPGSVISDFYRASLDAPGSSFKFFNGTFIVSGNNSKPKANETGTLLGYGKGATSAPNPAVPRLRLMSTQTSDYDWPVSRLDGTVGTGQFEFLPAR